MWSYEQDVNFDYHAIIQPTKHKCLMRKQMITLLTLKVMIMSLDSSSDRVVGKFKRFIANFLKIYNWWT